MTFMHLNQIQLAARWNISHRTLERWRWSGEGPLFVKIGGRVVYRLADIEAYELMCHFAWNKAPAFGVMRIQ